MMLLSTEIFDPAVVEQCVEHAPAQRPDRGARSLAEILEDLQCDLGLDLSVVSGVDSLSSIHVGSHLLSDQDCGSHVVNTSINSSDRRILESTTRTWKSKHCKTARFTSERRIITSVDNRSARMRQTESTAHPEQNSRLSSTSSSSVRC